MKDVERMVMADESGTPSSDPRHDLELHRILTRSTTRRIGWGTGRYFRAISRVVDLDLAYLVDSNPSKPHRRVSGIPVEPIERIAREDPDDSIVVVYSGDATRHAAFLATLGPYRWISAERLLRWPALPLRGADASGPTPVPLEALARRAVQRRFLWRILALADDTRFAIYGAGALAAVVLDSCRRLRREPCVVLDDVVAAPHFGGVPVRPPEAGLREFRPEMVLDARGGSPPQPTADGVEARMLAWLTRRAWSDWRTLCDRLDREGYHDDEAFRAWNRGHRRLYRRFDMIPTLGLADDSVSSLTELVRPERESAPRLFGGRRMQPAQLAETIRGLRGDDEGSAMDRLLAQRRVALVGPSEHLLREANGPLYDAHDCVVRLNTSLEHLPMARELARHVGARTDVLYLSIGYATKLLAHRASLLQRVIEESELRALVCLDSVLSVGIHGVEGVGGLAHLRDFVVQRYPDLIFHVETRTPRLVVPWLGGCAPRLGYAAMTDLLTYRPTALTVAGFTFYHGGGHLFRSQVIDDLDPTLSNDGRICAHDSRLELELLGYYRAAPELPLHFDSVLEGLTPPRPLGHAGIGPVPHASRPFA